VFNSFFFFQFLGAEEEERAWLLIVCLRQCNLCRNSLERDAKCGGGGGNVGVGSE